MDPYQIEFNNVKMAILKAIESPGDRRQNAVILALQQSFPSAGFELQGEFNAVTRKGQFTESERSMLEDVFRSLIITHCSHAATAGVPIMKFSSDTSLSSQSGIGQILDVAKWIVQSAFGTISAASPSAAASPPGARVLELAGYCRLLEDLLELGTIQDCQDVFACMEKDAAWIINILSSETKATEAAATASAASAVAAGQAAISKSTAAAGSHPAQLAILRSCNGLLRRLSKANDVQLCGRILVFIVRLYPLSDKSGLNLGGTINAGLPLPIDEVKPEDLDTVGQPIDIKLYNTFWNMQSIFKTPAQLLTTAAAWNRFKDDLSTILNAFSTLPITVPATGITAGASVSSSSSVGNKGASLQRNSGGKGSSSSMDVDGSSSHGHGGAVVAIQGGGGGESSATTVKYLTSSKLFGLQMRDATFRRHFLVQVSIQLHFLRHPISSKSAAAVAAAGGGGSAAGSASGRAGAATMALTQKQLEGLDELIDKVHAALSRTEPLGEMFVEAVKAVLERETQWVAWKREGCIPFERPPEPQPTSNKTSTSGGSASAAAAAAAASGPAAGRGGSAAGHKRRRQGAAAAAAAAGTGHSFAAMIAAPEDQMAGLKATERKLMPTLQEFLDPVKTELDPENGIEEEYKTKNDKVYAWKASRMLSRYHLSHFNAKDNLESAVLAFNPDLKKKVEEHKALIEARIKKVEQEMLSDSKLKQQEVQQAA
ncbi:hypothetical protein CEUSTIGMA_g7659.t1 [Chlamydomonas eustigma]|uniref:Uncharacterized protein n=1 Tax=Chlamydomonas eustigma TaxID=1157962 RepID=A0A250XAW0_9CHLO|nr:hypothetical protein CEUSTIGMA_g7659.t1 [Chlamydomonas eustigma]|eukprot:GAX80221.1 hypothetical protein CEUSTIGMA_g7659.t1 [Chlamydomonas eustigma]